MTSGATPLFRAFQEDHAVLGKGFYELSASLRGKDIPAARRVAARLNEEAGAHIAFEEECFYPTLAEATDLETDRLYDEHGEGLFVIRTLLELHKGDDVPEDLRRELLANAEAMEEHIAECGKLFEAIARIPAERQQSLYEELNSWRERHPTWLDFHRTREPSDAE